MIRHSARHPANNGRAMLVAWVDPALRDAARERARLSGLSLSDYVAAALRDCGVSEDLSRGARRRRRPLPDAEEP